MFIYTDQDEHHNVNKVSQCTLCVQASLRELISSSFTEQDSMYLLP